MNVIYKPLYASTAQGHYSHTIKNVLFSAEVECYDVTDVFLSFCRVICAKVVGATSGEGFLVN